MVDNYYTQHYLLQSEKLVNFSLKDTGRVAWESPSNIALVKYWGKFGDQLPRNPSVSFTLKNSRTITEISYRAAENELQKIEYYFENAKDEVFEQKIIKYLEKISVYLPFIKKLDLTIYSRNTFPHSAGIASSASSFSALALGICSIENHLFGTLGQKDDFYRKASFLARLGSGSACRSVYGKAVLWGKTDSIDGSSNEVATPIQINVHETFKTYYDAILIIDSGKKEFSSTKGHGLMENHPFAEARYAQASQNLAKILNAMQQGDEEIFSQIIENEALTLHGLMMSSTPSFSLLKPNTLHVIAKLKEFRDKNKINLTFTLDAGPNIHILYPEKSKDRVLDFINSHLKDFCENGVWIDDQISDGSRIK